MKLTRIRAVEQVKKMVALVDDIAETTIKNSVLGEEMRTKSPLGMQMIMTKLSGRNTVGKDTNGKFMSFFQPNFILCKQWLLIAMGKRLILAHK